MRAILVTANCDATKSLHKNVDRSSSSIKLPNPAAITRRQHLAQQLSLLQYTAAATIITSPALSAQAAQPTTTTDISQQEVDAPKIVYKSFIERDFLVRYPTTFQVIEDNPLDQPPGPRKENPVRVEIVPRYNTSSKARISVIQQQAAKLKQTLLQVTDISQLGSIEEVGQLLLPRGSKVTSATVASFAQPPRDTGTVLGVIERPPVQIYQYEVLLPNNQHAYVAVGALLGRILLLGASAPEEEWGEVGGTLKEIAESFKLLPK